MGPRRWLGAVAVMLLVAGCAQGRPVARTSPVAATGGRVTAGASAQPTVTPAGPVSTPPARADAAIAYDGAHDLVVLFGGTGPGGRVLTDTWTWDGSRWTRAGSPESPPAGHAGTMAFDGASGRVVLFAGEGTWTWDGQRWTRQQPAHEPPRVGRLAYDPSIGVVVLYSAGAATPTWGWNGGDWYAINEATGGPATPAGMAYDVRGARLLATGDGTWAFIGFRWTRLGDLPDALPGLGASLASSLTLNSPVAYGGGGLWAWDGKAWQVRDADPRPPARSGAALADDEKRQQLVLFGGTGADGTPTGDTWTWVPDKGWTRAA